MTPRKIKYIDGGSPEYWRQRKEGFRLIHEAERAFRRAQGAPLYIAGDWDEEYGDYEPIENLAPFERMDDAIRAIEANETAVDILVANRRTHFGDWPVRAVIRELAQAEALDDGDDPENPWTNPLWGPDTD